MEEHKELTKLIRNYISSEIKTGKYMHLSNPNKKNGASEDILKYKTRVNILFRPNYHSNGVGKKDAGSNETRIVFNLNFNYNNLEDGLEIENEFYSRVVAPKINGTYLSCILDKKLKSNSDKLCDFLEEGQYESFTKSILNIVNNSLHKVKKAYLIKSK